MENADLREGLLLGMGNPLLDITTTVDAQFLEKYNLKANDAILAEDKHKPMYKEIVERANVNYVAGGSVMNSLRVAQWILEKPRVTTFFGCVGVDDYAKVLEQKALSDGVNVKLQHNTTEPTGTCAVLITDHHRSLCANLGSANCFTIDHINKPENRKLISQAQFYYVSGFFLTVSPQSILEVAKYSLEHNRTFITNLSAQFISQFYKEPLMQVMPYVDLLFGNETEAETFANEQNFGTKDVREIALKMCQLPKQNEDVPRTVIITQGIDPIILAHEGKITEFPVIQLPKEKIVDTNGAGDAFVGGFLAQYIQNQPFDVCIRSGVYTASEIIQQSGCTYHGKATFKP